MPRRRGRGPVLTIAACLGAAAAVAVALALPPRQAGDVAVPPPEATPEDVVAAYLEALDVHDCATAEALMTPAARGQAARWCAAVASLDGTVISDHVVARPEYSGHSAPEEVVDVRVTFDLSWRPFHDDGSMDEGTTSWGYLLVRGSEGSPWRIFDQGMG